jgi:hypothetical protein
LLLNSKVSHAQLQRFLASEEPTSADLWRIAKPHVREIESADGVVIVEDSIAEKPYTDENDLICWHFDHSQQRTVKGINCVTCLYHSQGVSLPVGFALVRKTKRYTDPNAGKEKGNRKVALRVDTQPQGRYPRVDTLELEPRIPVTVYVEGVAFALLLIQQVFTNEEGSTGLPYLVTSDTTLDDNGIAARYQKRWNVQPYHKSLKQNASWEKSPTQTVTTQTNHFFAALCGYSKRELLKGNTQLNHFALKSKLYVRGIQSAYAALRELNPAQVAA